MEKLNIIVLTQEEHFFIPKNIFKASKVANVKCIVNNVTKSSLSNRTVDFLKWFGLLQFTKMGVLVVLRRLMSKIDRLTNYRTFDGQNSIKDMAGYLGVDYKEVLDVNSEEFADYVISNNIDLVVSYSAPQIIHEKLLSIPKHGIINVHGSLLPDYRGALPSFWYLHKNEKYGGATVHYMSKKIDDGDIILQEKTDISHCNSMFELMGVTKEIGGELIVKAIGQIQNGCVNSQKNDTENGSYYSFPKLEEAKEFRKNGNRLV